MKYLDYNGLSTFWTYIKKKFDNYLTKKEASNTYVTQTTISSYLTSIPAATSSSYGGIKIGYTTSGKNYAVTLDSNGKAYVNVPWTDTNTNTTYTAGTGISISGTTISTNLTKDLIVDALGYTPGSSTSTSTYTLPTASSTTLGGIKVGTGLSISSGVLSVDNSTVKSSILTNANLDDFVSNKAVTLSYGTTSTIATIAGVAITVTMPAASSGTSSGSGSTVSITRSLTSGTKSATITVDGTAYDIYSTNNTTYNVATTSSAGLMSASDKSKLDAIESGATAGGDTVSWSQSITSGTKIATITINGTATAIYAPTSSGTSSADGDTLDTTGTSNKTSTKMYIVGATTQASSTTTYSNSNCYINTSNQLVSAGSVVATVSDLSSYVKTTDLSSASVSKADNATTATKLGSTTVGGTAKPIYLNSGVATACSATVGGTTTPVYLNAGTITACSYTLAKSVPSTAVFTDTTYTGTGLISISSSNVISTTATSDSAISTSDIEDLCDEILV